MYACMSAFVYMYNFIHFTVEEHLGCFHVLATINPFSSVQLLSCVQLFVMLWTEYPRPPCPSETPRVYSDSCPLSWWCHSAISSCCPLLLLPSVFPRIRVFHISQLFTSGSRSIGGSASTLVLPMNTRDWSPLGWTGWIFLQSKGLSRVFSNTTVHI